MLNILLRIDVVHSGQPFCRRKFTSDSKRHLGIGCEWHLRWPHSLSLALPCCSGLGIKFHCFQQSLTFYTIMAGCETPLINWICCYPWPVLSLLYLSSYISMPLTLANRKCQIFCRHQGQLERAPKPLATVPWLRSRTWFIHMGGGELRAPCSGVLEKVVVLSRFNPMNFKLQTQKPSH
jgi:hypothetical protein